MACNAMWLGGVEGLRASDVIIGVVQKHAVAIDTVGARLHNLLPLQDELALFVLLTFLMSGVLIAEFWQNQR